MNAKMTGLKSRISLKIMGLIVLFLLNTGLSFGAETSGNFQLLKKMGSDNNSAAMVGSEMTFTNAASIRMGYVSNEPQNAVNGNLGNGLGFGFGIKLMAMASVDYAFTPMGEGGTHHMNLSLKFN